MDLVTDVFGRLDVASDGDGDDAPTYRSVTLNAYDEWAACAGAANLSAATPSGKHAIMTRCGPAGTEPFDAMVNSWDISEVEAAMSAARASFPTDDDIHSMPATTETTNEYLNQAMLLPTLKLDVTLQPHRVEDGSNHGKPQTDHPLVCSLRQFRVTARLLDATTNSVVTDSDFAHLRATLVYADDGLPVPAQNGEAALSGEIDHKRPTNGECTFMLRAAALSFKHGRRPFAIRIDAEGLASGPLTVTTHPIRSVARLPNESKAVPPPQPAAPLEPAQHHLGAAHHPSLHQARRPPAMPTVAPPSRAAPAPPPVAAAAQQPGPLLPFAPHQMRPPMHNTVVVEDTMDDDEMGGEDDECMLEPSEMAAGPYMQYPGAHGAADLMLEMQAQSHTIETLLQQQQQMLVEIDRERSKLRANGVAVPDAPCYAMCA